MLLVELRAGFRMLRLLRPPSILAVSMRIEPRVEENVAMVVVGIRGEKVAVS